MLNPSTADDAKDDPTIRRCKSFTARCGYERLVVVNLWAFRATDPSELRKAARDPDIDPTGGDKNLATIVDRARRARLVIAAWGAHAPTIDYLHVKEVVGKLEAAGIELWCLGKTSAGEPRHPLMLRSDAELVSF
jgi:hypothetical protein